MLRRRRTHAFPPPCHGEARGRALDRQSRPSLLSPRFPPLPTMSRQDKATTDRNARILRELVKQPDNKQCADCRRNGASTLSSASRVARSLACYCDCLRGERREAKRLLADPEILSQYPLPLFLDRSLDALPPRYHLPLDARWASWNLYVCSRVVARSVA